MGGRRDPEQIHARKCTLAYYEIRERYILHLCADALSSSKSVSGHIWGKAAVGGNCPLPQRRTALTIIYGLLRFAA